MAYVVATSRVSIRYPWIEALSRIRHTSKTAVESNVVRGEQPLAAVVLRHFRQRCPLLLVDRAQSNSRSSKCGGALGKRPGIGAGARGLGFWR